MKSFIRILPLLFTVLFVWGAYVQYNDPDALSWIAIYVVAALASLLFYLNKLPFLVALVLGIVYLILAISSWPDQFEGVTIGQGDIVNIERGREALGVLILSVVLFAYAIELKRSKA